MGERDESQIRTNYQSTGEDLHSPDNEKHLPLMCIDFESPVVWQMKLNYN